MEHSKFGVARPVESARPLERNDRKVVDQAELDRFLTRRLGRLAGAVTNRSFVGFNHFTYAQALLAYKVISGAEH